MEGLTLWHSTPLEDFLFMLLLMQPWMFLFQLIASFIRFADYKRSGLLSRRIKVYWAAVSVNTCMFLAALFFKLDLWLIAYCASWLIWAYYIIGVTMTINRKRFHFITKHF